MAKELSYNQRQKITQRFMKAAGSNDAAALQQQVRSGTDVNTRGWEGETGVIQATYYGHLEAVTTLITLGADLELREDQQHTALMIAARNNNLPIVRALVDGGADVTAVHASGSTARQLAVASDSGKGGFNDMITFLAQAETDAPQRAVERAVVLQRPLGIGRPLSLRKPAS